MAQKVAKYHGNKSQFRKNNNHSGTYVRSRATTVNFFGMMVISFLSLGYVISTVSELAFVIPGTETLFTFVPSVAFVAFFSNAGLNLLQLVSFMYVLRLSGVESSLTSSVASLIGGGK